MTAERTDAPGRPEAAAAAPWIVLLAASRGGLEAFRTILRKFPADVDAAVFLIQHIGDRPSTLPQILAPSCALPVAFATQGEPIRPGRVYVAPPDLHMILEADRVWLRAGPKVRYTRPAADPLFESAAKAFGVRVIAAVLTGGDQDGTNGLIAVRHHGGIGMVEDPSGAEDPQMPANALLHDTPRFCAPLPVLGDLLTRIIARPAPC
jgi:two-component system chemotaxis response regulator CheB